MRARVLAEEPYCGVSGCGEPSTQVDHIVPLSRSPELGLERSNLRGICASHNASKGARDEIASWCPHPLCTHPETCGGPNARWHL
jgi:5-methylcytosine-specific restriction endonuclease McrA